MSKSERAMRAHDTRRAGNVRIPRRGMCRRGVLAASSLLLALFLVTAAWGGDPSFVPGAPIPLGGPPIWIATGDFNGDAKPDLVAESREGKVTILLGNGLGRFAEAAGSPVAAGDGPCAVAVADIDDDGNTDLAVANSSSEDVSILLGDGAGGFRGSSTGADGHPLGITAADLNADGDMDLAVPNWEGRVAILLGDGAGGFGLALGSPVPVGSHPSAVAVADFNGDLKVDLAVANSESRELSILLGDGFGGFGTASSVPVPMGPRSLAVADLNRDEKPDLAVASQYSRDVTILLGRRARRLQRLAFRGRPHDDFARRRRLRCRRQARRRRRGPRLERRHGSARGRRGCFPGGRRLALCRSCPAVAGCSRAGRRRQGRPRRRRGGQDRASPSDSVEPDRRPRPDSEGHRPDAVLATHG